MSHPAWVCGLKLLVLRVDNILQVTPCVGVWIETAQEAQILLDSESHPAWVCGLKP